MHMMSTMAAAHLKSHNKGLESISEDEVSEPQAAESEQSSDGLPSKVSDNSGASTTVCSYSEKPDASAATTACCSFSEEPPIVVPDDEDVDIYNEVYNHRGPADFDEDFEPIKDHSRRRSSHDNLLANLTDEFEEALAQDDGDMNLLTKLDLLDEDDTEGDDLNDAEVVRDAPRASFFNAPVSAQEYKYAISVGVLLAFNAGFVNATCLTGLIGDNGRVVNVASNTGTITNAGLQLASGDVEEFGFLTSNTLSFLFGSLLAALLTPAPRPFKIEPSYGPSFLLGAACLTLSSTLSAINLNEKFIFHLASAAAGIQNGISSLYSANLIRSTGFTGTITDIGIFLGQFIRGNRKNTWKLVVMLFLLIAFWSGGLVAFHATEKLRHYSLLINAGLFVLIGSGVVAFLILKLDVSVGAALLGTYQWKRTFQKLQADLAKEIAANSQSFNNNEVSMKSQSQEFFTSYEHIDALFDQFDMDASGSIDPLELHAALRKAGIPVSKRQTARMVRRADKDGDGTISRSEFHDIVNYCNGDSTNRSTGD